MTVGRWTLLLVLLGAVAAFFVFDGSRYLDLATLQAGQGRIAALKAERPLAVAAVFFAAYVAVAALSLPGTALMTLLGGAVFGLVVGTLLASFASSLGALLAMLASRYLLRDVVRRRFGARLQSIDAGVQREGAWYLFGLRLVPLFPFFLINLALGLTAMKARTFYAVSQLGMLAGTVVYVYAGTQLARLNSLRDVASPGLVGAFVLLGVFPLLAKKGLDMIKSRQVYARWAHLKPRRFDRNLVVIGAGSAGLVTAYIAAAVKAKVTLVEAHRMGGDCLNTGCVPSKALIRSATLARQMRESAALGLHADAVRVDFAQVMERVARVVSEIEPHDSVERYTALGVDVRIGRATIVDPWHVRIVADDGGEQVLSTRAIVVATGARPVIPPLPGIDAVGALTSDTLWSLRELPPRLLVLGGGPIGCELAQAFARLGSQVTLVEQAARVLIREDEDVAEAALAALRGDGVNVLTGHEALRFDSEGGNKRLVARQVGKEGGAELTVGFDTVLCAVGRAARLQGFGLEELGIPLQRTLPVDERLRTLLPNILAAGDVAGPYQFTHVAAHQAWYAAVNGLFAPFKTFKADYRVIPAATFIDPEVARVGLNEQEAKAQGVAHEVTRFELHELDRAIVEGQTQGWVKVLTAPRSDRILGATIVGAHAAELLAEFVLAMKHGLGLNKILGTIHTYPTLAEANKYTAGAWKRAHQPEGLLRWVRRFHTWRRGGDA